MELTVLRLKSVILNQWWDTVGVRQRTEHSILPKRCFKISWRDVYLEMNDPYNNYRFDFNHNN